VGVGNYLVLRTDEAGVGSTRMEEGLKEYHPNINKKDELLKYKGYLFSFRAEQLHSPPFHSALHYN
jgi:hypothetical protein